MIAILGAGPHGREVLDVLGARCAGRVKLYDDFLEGFEPVGESCERFVLGAAWPATKRKILSRVEGWVEPYQDGVVVFPGAHRSLSATVGAHSHIGYGATISHGCTVGEFVTICAGAVLGGEVVVEDDVFVGANAVVLHGGLRVGRGAVMGAGAVVLKDVPKGAVVAGNPARVLSC